MKFNCSFSLCAAYGSSLVGSKNGMLESSLHMLLHIPNYVVENSKFDLIVLVSVSATFFVTRVSLSSNKSNKSYSLVL